MFRGLLLMLCACALLAPMTATAAQDEIFVDPGSPSGKEYALPIDSARKQAAGGAGAGVLLLGGAIGLILRRRSARTT
jgi:hypothetical protein